MINDLQKWFPALFLFLILIVSYSVYSPGIKGGFLFDDYANLQDMGDYGGVRDWETFKAFVFTGYSGPLGRPISLASFLLDDNAWPSNAEGFKETNIKIHLLCGLCLCWLILHLMRLMGRNENQAIWTAILTATIWLLHPFLLSTTLYVVQRMAQLATLFIFAGLIAYLYGRLLLTQGYLFKAYIWMSSGLVIGSVLAVFSKENGILLPLLAWVIEIAIPAKNKKPDVKWQWVFFGLPILVISYLCLRTITFVSHPWAGRPFNQIERLLSECRIIWEYLYYLFMPHIEGRGLFQDGYEISTNLINPPVTLIAVLGIGCLVILGVMSRKKYPLLSIAILFYMASHVIESTFIPLELYFEHRNYIGAGLIFLPLVASLVEAKRISTSVKSIIVIAIITTLGFLTFQRALLWSNTFFLEKYWALSAPESPRAQNKLASIYFNSGQKDKGFALIEAAMEKFPQSSLITANYLLIQVSYSIAEADTFQKIARRMQNQPFDAQTIMGIKNLTNAVINHPNKQKYIRLMIEFLDSLHDSKNISDIYQFKKIYPYSLANLYLALDDYDKAQENFSRAIYVHNDMDAAMSMVALMANADRPVEASMLLYQTDVLFKENKKGLILKRTHEVYAAEIVRIKAILDEDLKRIGISELIINKPKANQ